MKPFKELSQLEQEELMADAIALMHSKGFKYLMEQLMAEYTEQLIQAEVGNLTASTAHASMKVLRDVQNRLEALTKANRNIKPRG